MDPELKNWIKARVLDAGNDRNKQAAILTELSGAAATLAHHWGISRERYLQAQAVAYLFVEQESPHD